jgi:hypothetical protein
LPSLLSEHLGPERRQKGLPVYPASIAWKSLNLSRRMYVQFRTGACSIGGDYFFSTFVRVLLEEKFWFGKSPKWLGKNEVGVE